MSKDRAVMAAKIVYVSAARGAGRLLTRVGLLPEGVPARDHRVAHWAASLSRVHDSAALVAMDVPWWTYRAIDTVESWLAARRRPIRVFEYGSGASTVWLARRADEVHTVEHHRAFATSFAPNLAGRENVEMRVVEPRPDAHPAVPSAKEGNQGLDFSDYVATIDEVGGTFDLIVVDGRAREACLRRAIPHLAADGLVVFDNSGRRRYRRAIAASGLVERPLRGLTPTLPYPDCTSLLTLS